MKLTEIHTFVDKQGCITLSGAPLASSGLKPGDEVRVTLVVGQEESENGNPLLVISPRGARVVWRCASRIEKGKDACPHSPTLDKGWLQNTLSKAICKNGVYDESIIRNEVDNIHVFDTYILIFRTDKS